MRPPLTPAAVARFWASIDKRDGHWIWRGLKSPDGYGQTRGLRQAHRVSLELATGERLPDGVQVCHSPSCGRRDCVNPAHLRACTRQENADDKKRRRR